VAEPPPAEPAATPPPLPEGIPDAVRRAAEALHVPDAALRSAWDAYEVGRKKGGNVPPHFLDALRAQGPDGFRAVVALLRGDLNGSWIRDLARVGWAPGLESLLVETADDGSRHIWSRWSALDCLGVADSQASRDYLVARLGRETDAGLFFSASRALANLKDARAATAVAARIEEVAWGDAVRTSLMADLAATDPDRARDLLLRRIADPSSDLLEPSFKVLAGFDREAAKREAEVLLDGPRGRDLGPTLVWTLRDILGRPQKDGDAR
jgi:hypothetical protein